MNRVVQAPEAGLTVPRRLPACPTNPVCIFLFGSMVAAFGALAQEPAPRPRTATNRPIYIHKQPASYLGIGVAEIDAERAKSLNMKEVRGVEVKCVDPNSPAAKAGLKEGDAVLAYDGQLIDGTGQFVRVVRETPADRQVHISVWRNGANETLTATIGRRQMEALLEIPEMPPMPPMPPVPPSAAVSPVLGIDCQPLGSQLAAYFGVKRGVLVSAVAPGSVAEKAGLRAGDVITTVDGEPVTTPYEIVNQLRAAARGKRTFPLRVVREKKELTLTVTVEFSGRSRGALLPFGQQDLGLDRLVAA
jgi:serine protease Do